jgi:DNA polymerase (family 10)
MDSRTAAHTLNKIADALDVTGAPKFKSRAFRKAAKSILQLDTDDLAPLLENGELAGTPNVGPATVSIIRELVETGESSYLAKLTDGMPEGLIGLLRIPGLNIKKVHEIHAELGVETIDQLEEAAKSGKLATLKGLGPKTAQKLVEAIRFARESHPQRLFINAVISASQLVESLRRHPDITRAEIAGEVRRRMEVVGSLEIAAECKGDPYEVAQSLGAMAGVESADATPDGVATLRFVDGERLVVHCASHDEFGVALWRATGNHSHVDAVTTASEDAGISIQGNRVVGKNGKVIPTPDEETFYRAVGLQFVPAELREGRGEIEAAKTRSLPRLVEYSDLRGVLHCHSDYSDGTVSIAKMAKAAKERGWEYIGITDHSQAAHYAGGLKPEDVLRQHDEIDKLNANTKGFRILKGIEADILQDGRVDYDEKLLERFDFVIGSIHARFKQTGAQITERVLKAMDNPLLTILAHPTGRLLLSRPPYDLDIDAVLAKAVEKKIAIEVNADPHRLDLDWRYLHDAKRRGVMIEIGPDAHSPLGLDATELGVATARKGWLEAPDVLNTRSAEEIISFAKKKRSAADSD